MSTGPAFASLCLIAAILVLVYILASRRKRADEPGKFAAVVRAMAPLVLIVLIANLFVWGIQYRRAELRETAAATKTSPAEPNSTPEEPALEWPVARDVAASEPPQPSPVEPEKKEEATRGLAHPAPVTEAPAAPLKKPQFRVVPVFFGTDRARLDGAPRMSYGAERSRKLEMGRALVSVPTSHDVPAIERPWAVRIPYFDVKVYEEKEDPAKHFTVREIKTLTRAEMLALVSERLAASSAYKEHALIFVHGFNTSFDNAVYRTAQIAHDLKFDGASFMYSWPSGGAVASYTYDLGSSGQSQPYMREFVEMVVKDTKAKAVSVIAHSMGNQPLLQVLKDIKATTPDVLIHQVILAAPDVDRDNFENIAREIKGLAKGVTLYAAANDRALGVSRRFHGGVPRAGDVPASGPIVADGVDTIDVTAVSTDSLGLNHSSYAESNALLNDIGLLLQTGERPPDKRVPILSRVSTAKGEYWRYPGK